MERKFSPVVKPANYGLGSWKTANCWLPISELTVVAPANQRKQELSELLEGKAFLWASWDPCSVLTAAVRSILANQNTQEPVRVRLLRATSPQNLAQLVSRHQIGLAIWNVGSEAELPSICRAMMSARSKPRGPICVCFVNSIHLDGISILFEAGAQIVVSEIPSIQRALPRIWASAPFSQHAYHPLTSGLIDRLPWPEV